MDYGIVLVVGLVFWAIRSRRRLPRVLLLHTLLGAAVGAIVYPLLAGLVAGLGAARDSGTFSLVPPFRATSLRGASLGGLIGLCVALVRILPPRRRPAGRSPAGRSRRPFTSRR
jgi:hypothetical protein